MRRDFLDRYSRLDSPIHRASTPAKMIAAFAVIGITVAVPAPGWSFWLTATFLLLGVSILARIPFGYLGQRLLWFEPFIFCVALGTLFSPGGLEKFATVIGKSTLSLLTMALLANTTPFAAILRVLQACRLPSLLITTLALLYRYLFVLADEAQRMQRARLARSFVPKRVAIWHLLGTVIGQLFVRSTELAERIYAAMCSRGWR